MKIKIVAIGLTVFFVNMSMAYGDRATATGCCITKNVSCKPTFSNGFTCAQNEYTSSCKDSTMKGCKGGPPSDLECNKIKGQLECDDVDPQIILAYIDKGRCVKSSLGLNAYECIVKMNVTATPSSNSASKSNF